MRPGIVATSTYSGRSPSRPSITAFGVPCPRPVAPREPYISARTRTTSRNTPASLKARTNIAAARMGPTVWELEGPIPILKRSNVLMAIRHPPPGCVALL